MFLTVKKIIHDIFSAGTWERIAFLSRYKAPSDWDGKFRKQDMLPVAIMLFFCALILVIPLLIVLVITY